MEQNFQYNDHSVFVEQEGAVSKKFFANVFLWMFIALGLSTATAYIFGTNQEFLKLLITQDIVTGTVKSSMLGYIVMFAPLALVILMGAGFNRLPFLSLVGLFMLYSVLTGASLSFILIFYAKTSIYTCFAAAAGIFGIMAFLGYTTNVDLSKFRTILMIGLFGLVIATLINMFVQSAQFSLVTAYIGIAVFTALTAYDVQKIKRIGMGIEQSNGEVTAVDAKKMAIWGALSLYLDFLNIFLYLLRIFGSRK